MNAGHVDIARASTALGDVDDLLEAFFDPLEMVVEVEGAAFFEGHFALDGWHRCRDAASRDRLDESDPHVGAEERGGDVGVVYIEQRGGERLQLGCFLCRYIHHLAGPLVI